MERERSAGPWVCGRCAAGGPSNGPRRRGAVGDRVARGARPAPASVGDVVRVGAKTTASKGTGRRPRQRGASARSRGVGDLPRDRRQNARGLWTSVGIAAAFGCGCRRFPARWASERPRRRRRSKRRPAARARQLGREQRGAGAGAAVADDDRLRTDRPVFELRHGAPARAGAEGVAAPAKIAETWVEPCGFSGAVWATRGPCRRLIRRDCEPRAWLVTVKSTGPAPNEAGDATTRALVIRTETPSRGGRSGS